MITNIYYLKKYCKDYTKIENYEEALKSPLRYDLHHRLEISENKSKKDLIEENLYYDRPPEELVFLDHGEHSRLHNLNSSEETRKKMSDAQKGDKNPMFGKHLSAETRKKMSEAHKHLSAETRKKMSDAQKGKHLSAETRKKIAEANKHRSEETIKKLSEARKGKHWHLENGRRICTD